MPPSRSEPGRYFAESAMSMACVIHSHRRRVDPESEATYVDYILSDGLYGSFNAVVYDGARPRSWMMYDPSRVGDGREAAAAGANKLLRSNVYGPTCDSMDCVYKNVMLPSNVDMGDWLVFPYFGAYTLAGATNFNGIMAAEPPLIHFVSDSMDQREDNVIMWTCEMDEKPSPIVA